MHKAGIQVYADVIINHLCGADATERITVRRVDPDNRLQFTSDRFEIEAYTNLNFREESSIQILYGITAVLAAWIARKIWMKKAFSVFRMNMAKAGRM